VCSSSRSEEEEEEEENKQQKALRRIRFFIYPRIVYLSQDLTG